MHALVYLKSGGALTVANNFPILIFCNGEERWPSCEIVKVKIEIVVLGEGIEVCEVYVEEVLRTTCAEGCHFTAENLRERG